MKKGYILALAMCLALVMALSGCGEENAAPSGGASLNVDGAVAVTAAVSLSDGHLQGLVSSMETLALAQEVRSGDWEEMSGLLTDLQRGQVPSLIWFALPDGSYYSVDQGKTSANLSDRPYFPRVMAGNATLGDLVVSKSTGRKSMVATVPVNQDGKVVGALGASVYLDQFSEVLLRELQLPAGMVFYAVDGQGQLVLHGDPNRIMEKAADVGGQPFSEAVGTMLSQKEGKLTYKAKEGSETVAFKTSSLTGWTFALGIKGK